MVINSIYLLVVLNSVDISQYINSIFRQSVIVDQVYAANSIDEDLYLMRNEINRRIMYLSNDNTVENNQNKRSITVSMDENKKQLSHINRMDNKKEDNMIDIIDDKFDLQNQNQNDNKKVSFSNKNMKSSQPKLNKLQILLQNVKMIQSGLEFNC